MTTPPMDQQDTEYKHSSTSTLVYKKTDEGLTLLHTIIIEILQMALN